jgi:sulfite reductase (NADPH) flavoprotein alpha-component
VQHFFRHEGGVGNIEYTGNASDRVLGILHECPEEALPHLDAAEAYGYGYDRIDVSVKLLDERYLNIMVKGARDAGLDVSYVSELAAHPVHEPDTYPAFAPPSGDFPTFNATNLVDNPLYTALSGFVFDMSQARETHEFLKGFFGGEDMTLFHLKRMDTSTQNESLDMIKQGQLSEAQLRYLNVYLNEYAREYRYVGRYDYEFN